MLVVNKETMTLVFGYESYLLCKDLGIKNVPVSYNLLMSSESKDEKQIKNIVWYAPAELKMIQAKENMRL